MLQAAKLQAVRGMMFRQKNDTSVIKSEPESIDSASASDAAPSTDNTGVYDSEDEYVEIGADDTKEDNILMIIVIVVAAAGIAAVGFAVFVLRKNGEH